MWWKRILVPTLGYCIQGFAFEMASRGKPEGMHWVMLLGFAIIILGGRIGLKEKED